MVGHGLLIRQVQHRQIFGQQLGNLATREDYAGLSKEQDLEHANQMLCRPSGCKGIAFKHC